MQFKLCWIWLQQVRVWLLSQRLRTGKNPDSQQFPQVVSRGEGSIHEVHQHAKILHKRSRGDFDPIWREQQKRHGQQRPNSTISANMTCSRGFEPSWWNCEGQILCYCYVICTTEQTNPFPEKDVWPNEQETWFGTDHWEGKGRKRKKTGIYEDISNQKEVNFALRFETLDLPPYGKESSCKHSGRLRQYKDRLSFAKCPHLT